MRFCLLVMSKATRISKADSYTTWLPKCKLNKDYINSLAKPDGGRSPQDLNPTRRMYRQLRKAGSRRCGISQGKGAPIGCLVLNGHHPWKHIYTSNIIQTEVTFRNLYVSTKTYMHEITTNKKKRPWIWRAVGRGIWEFGGKEKNVVNIHIFYKIAKT